MNPGEPLACAWRSGEIESVHLGHLAVVDREGRLLVSRGDPETPIWIRSAAKPFQALPLWLSGVAAGLAPEALAVTMASHSGEAAHRAAVQQLLDAGGLEASQLGCGIHAPYADPALKDPDVLHCNCSGKHAGMLLVCQRMGWDLATYREPDHPLQRWIRDLIAELAGVDAASIGHGVDGCSAPVWRLPVIGLARAFARLPGHVAQVMAAHPQLIAGTGRLDTDLIAAGAGRLVSKIGGEAVHGGADLPAGLGWGMKVGDGNRRAIAPALARAMELAGSPLPEAEKLARHVGPAVKNNHGDVVGRVVAAF